MGEVDDGKICAFLAYIFPIGLIWYLVDEKMKKNKFVAHHVYQSLAAVIVVFIGQIVGSIIPILGWFIILPLVMLAGLVWFIQGLIYSLGGQKKDLFLIGKFGHKFNF